MREETEGERKEDSGYSQIIKVRNLSLSTFLRPVSLSHLEAIANVGNIFMIILANKKSKYL